MRFIQSMYVAQFHTFKACRHAFTKADATRMLTGLMVRARGHGASLVSLRLRSMYLPSMIFKRPPRQLQREHKQDRASTAQALYFDCAEPMPLANFFEFFLKRDETVIMTNDENRRRPSCTFPYYIEIDAQHELFPCGTLVGWQHRKAEIDEIDFLRVLHARQQLTNEIGAGRPWSD